MRCGSIGARRQCFPPAAPFFVISAFATALWRFYFVRTAVEILRPHCRRLNQSLCFAFWGSQVLSRRFPPGKRSGGGNHSVGLPKPLTAEGPESPEVSMPRTWSTCCGRGRKGRLIHNSSSLNERSCEGRARKFSTAAVCALLVNI